MTQLKSLRKYDNFTLVANKNTGRKAIAKRAGVFFL
jgi:hypothetical protein